ncbi:hypothetical protein [Bowdeniella massiliensis]|uniref:hypothetical protein n=1 Tax=Bowdeniella massiliensis TaxID=2932264 RepID=UPI002028AC85|nr:hypothetical protein [Bowdeniella massiliensis]
MSNKPVLAGHRSEKYWVNILNRHDVPIGVLDGFESGSISLNVNATIRGGGSLDYTGPEIEWHDYRLQPWFHAIDETTGEEIKRPLGIYLPTAPGTSYDTARAQTIELYDKTDILNSEKYEQTFTVPAGANVVQWVRSIIASTGETAIAIDDSDETLRTAQVFDHQFTKLQIVNKLLDSIEYFALWCDGWGVYRSGPRKPPQQRAVEVILEDTEDNALYDPAFTHDYDSYRVANHVVALSETDGEKPPLRASARNDNPDSPFSTVRRGRVITRFEESVEATSQAVLQAYVNRLLWEEQQVLSKFQIKHAHVDTWFNDVVTFRATRWGIDVPCVIQKHDITLKPGEDVSTELREIVNA